MLYSEFLTRVVNEIANQPFSHRTVRDLLEELVFRYTSSRRKRRIWWKPIPSCFQCEFGEPGTSFDRSRFWRRLWPALDRIGVDVVECKSKLRSQMERAEDYCIPFMADSFLHTIYTCRKRT